MISVLKTFIYVYFYVLTNIFPFAILIRFISCTIQRITWYICEAKNIYKLNRQYLHKDTQRAHNMKYYRHCIIYSVTKRSLANYTKRTYRQKQEKWMTYLLNIWNSKTRTCLFKILLLKMKGKLHNITYMKFDFPKEERNFWLTSITSSNFWCWSLFVT